MSHHLTALVRAEFGAAVVGSHAHRGDETILVDRDRLVDLMRWLRDDPRTAMDVLVDVTALDLSEFPAVHRAAICPVDDGHPHGDAALAARYQVVYHLLSMGHRHRLRVKVALPEDDARAPSLCDVWIAANWGERETYDMYGVQFDGHPDLRRVLLYDGFEGHPLRKDYPLRGYQPLTALPTLSEYADNEVRR